MALIDRLKERVETDLQDDELSEIIAEAQATIAERYGSDGAERTETFEGGAPALDFVVPIDTTKAVTVTEYRQMPWGEESVLLAGDDWRSWYGGRTLERLATGTNAASHWAARVDVTYTPVSRAALRDEATLKLCALSIEYRPLASESAGDHSETKLRYDEERERILRSLAPRGGMIFA